MNRRDLLLQLVTAAVLMACRDPGPRLDDATRQQICTPDVDKALATLPPDLAVLGHYYLVANPEEHDGELLVGAVLGAVETGEALLPSLLDTIREEYEQGIVASAGGWRLSLTEARLAGLVYLSGLC